MRKPPFAYAESMGADKWCSKSRSWSAPVDFVTCVMLPLYILLSKVETSSLWPFPVVVRFGLCRAWTGTPKITAFS